MAVLRWEQMEEVFQRDDADAFEALLATTRHPIDLHVGHSEDDLIGLGMADWKAVRCMQRALKLGLHLENESREYTALFHAAENGHGDLVELLADYDANLLGEFSFNDETPLSIAAWKLLDVLKPHNDRVSRMRADLWAAQQQAYRNRVPHSTAWELTAARIKDGTIDLHALLQIEGTLPATLLDTAVEEPALYPKSSFRDYFRSMRALLRKHAIAQSRPTDVQQQLLDATRRSLPDRCARLMPIVHRAPQPLNDVEFAARLVEYNSALTAKVEAALTEQERARFPFLLCQWRGVHFYKHFYTDMQRDEYVRCSHLNRLAPAPAVFAMAEVEVGRTQLMRESAAEQATITIRQTWQGFQTGGQQRAYWGEPLTFSSPRDMLMYRSTTDMSAYNTDVATRQHPHLTTLRQTNIRGNPTCATSEVPHQAVRYALGLKAFESVRRHRLRPQYNAAGVPAHPTLGKVFVALLEPHEMAHDSMLHVSEAHHEGLFDLDMRFANERESGALGGFSKGKFFYEHSLTFPRLDGKKGTREARALGTDKQTIDNWTRQLREAKAQGREHVQQFEEALTRELVDMFQTQLYDTVTAESARRGCRLVYRAGKRKYAAVPQPLRRTASDQRIYSNDDLNFVTKIGPPTLS